VFAFLQLQVYHIAAEIAIVDFEFFKNIYTFLWTNRLKYDILFFAGKRAWRCFSKHWKMCTFSGGIAFTSNDFGLPRPKSGLLAA